MSVQAIGEFQEQRASGSLIERFLRQQRGIWRQIEQERDLPMLIAGMLAHTAAGLAAFGLVMGTVSGHPLQMLSAAIKLPLLCLLTMAICIPAFYLFNLLYGGRMSVLQTIAMVMTTMTMASVVVMAFLPIALFFRLAAWDQAFFRMLCFDMIGVGLLMGLKYQILGLKSINSLAGSGQISGPAHLSDWGEAGPSRPLVNLSLLYSWFLVSVFIGVELMWSLSPFFGRPNEPFTLFASTGGNFFLRLVRTLVEMLTGA